MEPRDLLSLDGPWRFSPDPHADGERLGFCAPGFSDRLWRETPVPSVFEAGCPDIDFYEGVCWYRRAFSVPASWRGKRMILHFEAVNYRAKVWLNGVLLGEHRDGFLPFEFDVSETVLFDAGNNLAVSVDNAHHEGDVPGMHTGWRGYGGILRGVWLNATGRLHVEGLRVVAEPCAGGGRVACRVLVRNARPAKAGCSLSVSISTQAGEVVGTLGPRALELAAGACNETTLEGVIANAHAWSPSSPALYHAVARIEEQGAVVDALDARFGFRRIEATPDGLALNGGRIFLTGFNRHEDSPRTAMASDSATVRRDLERMKDAGANFVRLCHYPHDPAELDLCDELGMLAFCEIPLYFWNDVEEGRRTNSARVESARRQLECMIARDANHPAIIFWSVSNETHEDEPAVAEANSALIRKARALDPTRLCVHVSNHWTSHPHFDDDDVICVNGYPSIDWPGHGMSADGAQGRAADFWRTNLAALRSKYPSKPVLVTEFGYCSFAGTHGHAFGEDMHAQVIEAEFAGMDAPYVCGAAIWCWADHPWPAGRFLGGLSISPFGVVSRERHALKPLDTARRMFRARQALDTHPPPPWPAGTGVVMIRPHMRDLVDTPFPEGYGIRPMSVHDIGLWTDIQRDAEPYLEIKDGTFIEQFGDDLAAIAWRCFIITDAKGRGVGTISAWYSRDFRGEDYGRIHWVAVRPSSQRKGLARSAMSFAMRKLAQWHDRCYLDTSAERIGAIKLYLEFGFEPDLTPANAPALWQDIHARLR